MARRGDIGRSQAGRLVLDLYACFLIPSYTLLYAGGKGWLTTNFSVLAAMDRGRFFGCLSWGLVVGIYFLVMLLRLSAYVRGRLPLRVVTVLACGELAAALVLPYRPELLPRAARVHVTLASSASVLMMLVLLAVVLEGWGRDRGGYAPFLRGWAAIAAVSLVLLALAGMVSAAVEIFFAISAALLVRRLWLYREEGRE